MCCKRVVGLELAKLNNNHDKDNNGPTSTLNQRPQAVLAVALVASATVTYSLHALVLNDS